MKYIGHCSTDIFHQLIGHLAIIILRDVPFMQRKAEDETRFKVDVQGSFDQSTIARSNSEQKGVRKEVPSIFARVSE